MDDCQHLRLYDHKDYTDLYKRCQRCGQVQKTEQLREMIHPYQANRVAMELNIRHDDVDGDV